MSQNRPNARRFNLSLRGRRYSIRLALVAFVVGPVVIALGLVALATERVMTSFAERRMQEEVELVASTIRLPLGRALAAGRVRDVERALRSAVRVDPIYAVFVYNARGVPLAAIGEEALPVNVDVLSRVIVDGESTGTYTRMGERRVYSFSSPLRGSSGERVGIVQVVRRRSDFDSAIAGLRRQTIAVLLISCFGVSGLVLWGHDRAVGRALHRLEDDIDRIDKEPGHRSAGTGPREVARVASALNDMLDRRERDEDEIDRRRGNQRELEERLQHTEKLAAVGRLASGLAHELGTPLSVIDGHAQRELRRWEGKERSLEVMTLIRKEVERMSSIVRQLLDFARRPRAAAEIVELSQVVEAAVTTVKQTPSAADTNLSIVRPPAPVNVLADAAGLERVLVNLLDNAAQAAPGGEVMISFDRDEDMARVTVEDSGPGIPEEVRQRIFEPFFTTKAVGKGTGLGLAVVHGLLKEHEASIDVGSSKLGGARFDVYVPRAKENEDG